MKKSSLQVKTVFKLQLMIHYILQQSFLNLAIMDMSKMGGIVLDHFSTPFASQKHLRAKVTPDFLLT